MVYAISRCAHLGNIFVGLAGPVAFAAGPVLSSVWFPPHQRTTATAIATIAGFAGAAACFVVGKCQLRHNFINRRHASAV